MIITSYLHLILYPLLYTFQQKWFFLFVCSLLWVSLFLFQRNSHVVFQFIQGTLFFSIKHSSFPSIHYLCIQVTLFLFIQSSNFPLSNFHFFLLLIFFPPAFQFIDHFSSSPVFLSSLTFYSNSYSFFLLHTLCYSCLKF